LRLAVRNFLDMHQWQACDIVALFALQELVGTTNDRRLQASTVGLLLELECIPFANYGSNGARIVVAS
jgi:hypothetical protein